MFFSLLTSGPRFQPGGWNGLRCSERLALSEPLREVGSVGTGDVGLTGGLYFCVKVQESQKRKCIPQKTSQAGCLVTALQLWRRLLT